MEFVTPEERIRLERQLEGMKSKRKPLSDRIAAARELGDLRENADYHAAREDQGMNEAKIRQLEERLAAAQIADTEFVPDDMVFIGATVRLRDVDSEREDVYRLVGEATGDLDVEFIEVTINSPMGKALMKARIGEVVRVDLPRGERRFAIIEIVA